MSKASILLVDDNSHQHELFKCYAMYAKEVDVHFASSLSDALESIKRDKPKAVLLDNRLHPYESYLETVPILREAGFDGKIVVISADISGTVFAAHRAHSVECCVNKFDFNLSNFSQRIGEMVN